MANKHPTPLPILSGQTPPIQALSPLHQGRKHEHFPPYISMTKTLPFQCASLTKLAETSKTRDRWLNGITAKIEKSNHLILRGYIFNLNLRLNRTEQNQRLRARCHLVRSNAHTGTASNFHGTLNLVRRVLYIWWWGNYKSTLLPTTEQKRKRVRKHTIGQRVRAVTCKTG